MIRQLMVILSGSRAAEYFVPGSCVEGLDLDFYCRIDLTTMIQFWLEVMGVHWSQESDRPGANSDYLVDYTASGFQVLRGTLYGPTGTLYEV